MCGIAGYVGPALLSEERLLAGLRTLDHRGPDHAAHRSFELGPLRVELLHTRLSILDLDDRSNQPFRAGGTWTVVNGELYNYVEMRDQLRSAGRRFTTTGDTEVFSELLRGDVLGGLERAEGMFALAHVDEQSGEVWLARDRFGEKPLFMMEHAGGLLFASEVKALAALAGSWPVVNRRHLSRYLVNGYKSLFKTTETFFEGVWELPSGTALRLDASGRRAYRYWDVPTYEPDEDQSYDDAVVGVRERLMRSVELRMRADVPIAFCMSGGVDSNALIGAAVRGLGREAQGFTVVNTDERYSEMHLVDRVVAELGIEHTSVPLSTTGFLPELRRLVKQHDAPVSVPAYYGHWRLMEAVAAAGCRISISGTGADELFSGYYDHHLWYIEAMRGDPSRQREARRQWEEHVAPWVRNPLLQDAGRFVADPAFRDHIYLHADTFAGRLVEPFVEPFTEVNYASVPMRNRMANELFHEAVPVILREDDLNAMGWSVENRSPFLDRELFEFSSRIPTRHLVRDGRAKAVLRDAVRGLVPDAVVDERRKVGFNVPMHSLLDTTDSSTRAELLDPASPIWELVDRKAMAQLLDRPELPNSESKFLYYFLNAKIFLEEFAS